MENFTLLIMTLIFIMLGIGGLFNFNRFFEFYCKFMDSRNSLDINYSKGTYTKVILKIMLILCLLIGLIGLISFFIDFLNIFL